jgi:uncharacterized glyoxalase superfamily protein PhnB
MPVRSAIIPNLHYDDAPAAIAFLCAAFGFEARAVHYSDSDPSVVQHAQLVLDGNMIMLSTYGKSDYGALAGLKTVQAAGGNTQIPYIVIDDVAGHHARAKAAGADIFMEPVEQDYGGSNYSARDPEGYVWSFGDYDPWADAPET